MIEIYADGAAMDGIVSAAKNKNIMGFTTNPSLMRNAGITNYLDFCNEVIPFLKSERPETNISLEVFADDFKSMYSQAMDLNELSKKYSYDVFVKIPVTNTMGLSTAPLVTMLLASQVKVNITAVFTPKQTSEIIKAIGDSQTNSIISIFAGRIADSGRNAVNIVRECIVYNGLQANKKNKNIKFLWASTRQAYNYNEAIEAGCDIITMTPDIIKKMDVFGKNLTDYSLETVKMFYNDALKSGYTI
jgi:transaldolase